MGVGRGRKGREVHAGADGVPKNTCMLYKRVQNHLELKASATVRKGPSSTPVTAHACRSTKMAISTAPPAGTSVGLRTTFRATDIASAGLWSIISLDSSQARNVMYLRKEIVSFQAFRVAVRIGKIFSEKEGIYLLPIFSMLNSPQRVSDVRRPSRSSTRLTLVASPMRAMRLSSDLHTSGKDPITFLLVYFLKKRWFYCASLILNTNLGINFFFNSRFLAHSLTYPLERARTSPKK
jgi:hypothetical protein